MDIKIGFPLQNPDEMLLSDGFHGSKWVGVYDESSGDLESFLITEFLVGADKTESIFTNQGICAIICNTIHPMALKLFHENKIDVYKSESCHLYLNVELFKSGKLKKYTSEMTERSTCSSSCSSCDSTTCA